MNNNISIEVIGADRITECKDLCNKLMAYQKSKAVLYPENFNSMNFDSRMKASYKNALRSHLVMVKDGAIPIGYIFTTVDEVTEENSQSIPDWAPRIEGMENFYPKFFNKPQLVGCLNNLYIEKEYRGLGLGDKLYKMSMDWLSKMDDVKVISVFISNGNQAAYDFYIHEGFKYSHDVFGGFIKAAFRDNKKSI
ncbi:MAG: GNAT family N-acetyltransferase [Peptostreptococcus sp.]|uniref:GNAT family N-acetyltransferase n=1 Tax=Peptostreptococcus sp. TaxID=1262 RepID=UPI002FC8F2BB